MSGEGDEAERLQVLEQYRKKVRGGVISLRVLVVFCACLHCALLTQLSSRCSCWGDVQQQQSPGRSTSAGPPSIIGQIASGVHKTVL